MSVFPEERKERGIFLLRISLALLFIWFGFNQIIYSNLWTSIVPNWAISLLPFSAKFIVLLNGSFELIFGATLFFGFYARFSSLILFIHIAPIIFSVVYGAMMARD